MNCTRPGATHGPREAKFQLTITGRKSDWGVSCRLCSQCARDFRRQFVAMITYGLARLEPIDAAIQN